MLSIQQLITQAAQRLATSSDSPVLDAEVLLCFVLKKPRSYLRAWCDSAVTKAQQTAFTNLVTQRQQGQPIAYLTGVREFWSREFLVSPAVLIPRPDTELLIELSLPLVPTAAPYAILDLGTGSGIIAITLAAERPNAQIIATDISPLALQIAQQNANRYQLNNILFYQSDWFTHIPAQHFQLIISNPPYIAADDAHLQQGDLRFEPQNALIAADAGLSEVKTIVATAKHWLTANGQLLIEHGYNQADVIQDIFKAEGYAQVQTYQDLSGQARVTGGIWDSSPHSNNTVRTIEYT